MNENEMNDLERHLHSWVPRRPSAKLEATLFPDARPAETSLLLRLNWLAPASISLLLAALFLCQHNSPAIGSASPSPMIAMMLSNQSAIAYLPGDSRGSQNRLPNGYEWTPGNASTSSPNITPLQPYSVRPSR